MTSELASQSEAKAGVVGITAHFVFRHLPRVWNEHYRDPRRASVEYSATEQYKERVGRATSGWKEAIETFQERGFFSIERFASGYRFDQILQFLDRHGVREEVWERKRALSDPDIFRDHDSGIPHADYFPIMQQAIKGEVRNRFVHEVFPEVQEILELCHGRRLRIRSLGYQHNDGNDPSFEYGGSRYIAHTYHIDSSPRLAKALLYLTDVDSDCGPFELLPNSRRSFLSELLQVARLKKTFPKKERWMADRLPTFLNFRTHGIDLSRESSKRNLVSFTGVAGTLILFNGMLVHGGSRNQTKPREVLQFVFE